jgi:uncharacterized protein YhjY with autotransporter beta-barrel domain
MSTSSELKHTFQRFSRLLSIRRASRKSNRRAAYTNSACQRSASLVVVFISLLFLPQTIIAQSLDQAIQGQLGLDCQGLTGGGSAAGLSPELNSICAGGNSTGSGSSSGGGLGAAQSLGATVENRRQERLEGKQKIGNHMTFSLGEGIGLFFSGNVEALNRSRTAFADGFDSTVLGATVGGDYRLSNHLLAGLALNYVNRDGRFDGGGDFSTNSYGFLGYTSFMPTPSTFLDVSVGYTRHNYLLARPTSFVEAGSGDSIGGIASSNTHGNEFLLRAVAGYDFTFKNMTIGPRIGLNYSNLSIGSYAENGGGGLGLSYDNQTVHSLQSTIGVQGTMAVSTSYGVWVPQMSADFIHEYENDSRLITVQFTGDGRDNPTRFTFQTDNPDRDFFNLSLGTVLILPNGIQPFVNFRAMVGNNQFENYVGTIGIRIQGS